MAPDWASLGGPAERARASSGPSELADLPVEVRQLVRAVDQMRDGWAESALPGYRLSARQQELWRAVHEACDAVWNRGEHRHERADVPHESD